MTEAATIPRLLDAGALFAFVHGSRAQPAMFQPLPLQMLRVAAWWGAAAPAAWEVPVPGVALLVLDGASLRLAGPVVGDVAELRALAQRPEDIAANDMALKAVKYSFVTIIGGASRVAQHIVVAQNWRVGESNADAFHRLADDDVMPSELAENLARAVGFRDALLHRYDDVPDELVLVNLDRLGDFEEFARHVSAWLPTG